MRAKESLPPVIVSAILGYSMPTQLQSLKDAYNAPNNMPLSPYNQILGFIWFRCAPTTYMPQSCYVRGFTA